MAAATSASPHEVGCVCRSPLPDRGLSGGRHRSSRSESHGPTADPGSLPQGLAQQTFAKYQLIVTLPFPLPPKATFHAGPSGQTLMPPHPESSVLSSARSQTKPLAHLHLGPTGVSGRVHLSSGVDYPSLPSHTCPPDMAGVLPLMRERHPVSARGTRAAQAPLFPTESQAPACTAGSQVRPWEPCSQPQPHTYPRLKPRCFCQKHQCIETDGTASSKGEIPHFKSFLNKKVS